MTLLTRLADLIGRYAEPGLAPSLPFAAVDAIGETA